MTDLRVTERERSEGIAWLTMLPHKKLTILVKKIRCFLNFNLFQLNIKKRGFPKQDPNLIPPPLIPAFVGSPWACKTAETCISWFQDFSFLSKLLRCVIFGMNRFSGLLLYNHTTHTFTLSNTQRHILKEIKYIIFSKRVLLW